MTANEIRTPTSQGTKPHAVADASRPSRVSRSAGGDAQQDPYRLVKPGLCDLLDTARIGVEYQRAEGDRLYYGRDGREIEVVDWVGGYGALLFGHNPPEIVAEAQRLLSENRPVLAQGSRRGPAGRLAAELSRRAGGGYRVVLTNSGAEAVEVAMKHAMRVTGGRTFIALEGGFHGKTLGALQLTANPDYREPFVLEGLNVLRVRADDLAHLEEVFAQAQDLAGFIFEPVQGEGGVRPLDPAFVQRAARLCAERHIPLMADEIQSGLGRTGTFLASEPLGVRADCVMLSKALGGGLAKIGAVLIDERGYADGFDVQHTSTFAEDDFSSAIALRTLQLLDEGELARCRTKGEQLLGMLESLRAQYPDVIATVRGRGLMIGIELARQSASPNVLLRMLTEQGDLGFAVMAHLFHRCRIRVAPTLSDPFTLRIEPSLRIGFADMERLCAGLEDVCRRIRRGDAAGLTGCLIGEPDEPEPEIRWQPGAFIQSEPRFRQAQQRVPDIRVGWIAHFIDADALVSFDPAFARFSYDERERYLRRAVARGRTALMSAVDVRSATGQLARLYTLGLFLTSRRIKELLDRGDASCVLDAVRHASDVAVDLGCQVVALAQYTSMVTAGGTRLRPPGVGVTTGNSYAVALGLEAVARAEAERGVDPAQSTLAVVGAGGNIGQVVAETIGPQYRKVWLVGSSRPHAVKRLQKVAGRLPNAEISTDPAVVRSAQVVVVGVNAVDAPLGPEHFHPDALVCDLSVPAGVRPEVQQARPDVLVVRGGVVQLPGREDLGITSFPLPRGQTFGCMGEGLLLGFEGVRDTSFTGLLTPRHIARVQAMARRHGFRLSDYKTQDVLGGERETSRAIAV